MKSKHTPHQQRSRRGAKDYRAVTIRLTEKEYGQLMLLADANLRSVTSQVVWLLREALGAPEEETRDG